MYKGKERQLLDLLREMDATFCDDVIQVMEHYQGYREAMSTGTSPSSSSLGTILASKPPPASDTSRGSSPLGTTLAPKPSPASDMQGPLPGSSSGPLSGPLSGPSSGLSPRLPSASSSSSSSSSGLSPCLSSVSSSSTSSGPPLVVPSLPISSGGGGFLF